MDVISLYDYTGEMLRPWARFSKVNCYAYDIQHVGQSLRGGKSAKTKNIRSATPRGFAKAVACANMPTLWT